MTVDGLTAHSAVRLLGGLQPIFSFDLVSYGAGLTNMPLRTFAVATGV